LHSCSRVLPTMELAALMITQSPGCRSTRGGNGQVTQQLTNITYKYVQTCPFDHLLQRSNAAAMHNYRDQACRCNCPE
jgi:hypothetical protein